MKVEWKPVGQLCTLDRTPIQIDSTTIYRKAGVRSFGKGIFDYEPMPGADLGKLRFHNLEPNCLIVSNIKAWEGAIAITGLREEGRVVSNRFLTYRASADVSLPYLLHWFLSKRGNSTLQQASPGSADRNRTLSIDGFERILVPIPSRPDQDRIAAHLDSLVAPARFSGDAAKKAEQLLRNLRERVLSRLAKHNLAPLRTVLRPADNLEDVEPDHMYRMLGVRSFGRGAFAAGTLLGANTAYKKLRQFHVGQVCYPKLMGWQGAFSTVPEPLDGYYTSPEFVGFYVDSAHTSPAYIDQCLRWESFVDAAATASSGTNANRRRLQPQDFLSLPIPLPDKDTQSGVVTVLGTAMKAAARAQVAASHAAAILPAARNEVFAALATR